MLRFRMGFGALAMVIAISSVMTSLLPAVQADALTDPGGGGGSWSVTATFEDSADIAVLASGTDSPNANTNLDMSAVQGIYFNGNTVPDGSQWPITAGSQTKYWFNNNKTSTCQGNNSNIVITDYSPGNVTATFNLYLPETDSVAQTGKCYAVSMTGQPVDDTSAGGNINTFKIGSSSVCGGRGGCVAAPNDGYEAITLGADASTTNYFLASNNQIIAAGADPSQSGGGAKYTFNQATVNGKTVFKQPPGSGVGACPDEISMPTTTGLFIQATYTTWGQTTNCNNGAAGTTYTILVLGETPGAYFAGLGGTGSDTGDGGSGSTTAAPPDTCPIQNWALRWLICPILDVIDQTVSVINSYLANLLIIPASWFDTTGSPGKAYFAAWGTFRDIAVSLMVIAALVMVIGESAGFDLLDAYSIRKLLPRLLTGAVAMSLSWVICTFIIQLFNNLINWVPDIILSPFQTLYATGDSLTPTGVLGSVEQAGGQTLGVATMGAGVIAAILILQVPGILSLLVTLFIAMVTAFITLTIRAMVILLWLITSPLWIACYILPTTRKGYELGRDTGVAALVGGVIIALYITGGQLVAIIAIVGKGFVPIMAPVAVVLSYIGLPNAYRQAGAAVAGTAGLVQGATSGIRNKQKEYRHGLPKKRAEQAQEGKFFKGALGSKFNSRIQRAALTPKAMMSMGYGTRFKPKDVKGRLNTLQGNHEESEASHIKQEGEYFAAHANDDNFNWAIMETTAEGAKKSGYDTGREGVLQSLRAHLGNPEDIEDETKRASLEHTINETADRVMAAKHHYGDSQALFMAATRAQAGTGTGFKNTELKGGKDRAWTDEMQAFVDGHEEGRDYHVEDDLDENGDIQYDTGGNVRQKVVAHDATGKMYDWINVAAGHDRGVAVNMFAEMRNAANQSGRFDLGGAGFGDGYKALSDMYDASHRAADEGTLITDAERQDPRFQSMTPAQQQAFIEQRRREYIHDQQLASTQIALISAATGNDMAQLSGGKPYAAEALGRTQYSLIQARAEKMQDAQAALAADPTPQNQRAAEVAERNLKQATAAAAGVWDTMGARSHLNAQTLSNVLTGQVMPGVTAPVMAPRIGADGSPVMEHGQPVMEEVGRRPMTVIEYYRSVASDPEVEQYRRELERGSAAAQAAALGGGAPPAGPAGPAAPAPPT